MKFADKTVEYIQMESKCFVVVTGPGKLSRKRVIHAVGVPYEVMNPEEVCDQRTYIFVI